MAPQARQAGLVVEELSDETLVYDRERHKAHCLNETAAFVWRHCDGETEISELAERLEAEFGSTASGELVRLAMGSPSVTGRADAAVDCLSGAYRAVVCREGHTGGQT